MYHDLMYLMSGFTELLFWYFGEALDLYKSSIYESDFRMAESK